MPAANGHAKKNEIRYDHHNRKSGRAAFWKHLVARKVRRHERKLLKLTVENPPRTWFEVA